MNSYKTLATIYETLMKDCDYDKWSQYLLNCIKKYSNGNRGLDLACGSGKITRFLAKNGYKMVGGDISEEMLIQAKNLSDKEKLNVNYFKADLCNLKLYGKFNFITIINDGINYVQQDKLLKTFTGLHKNLEKNGILLFDISSKYKLEEIIGNNLFGEDLEEVSYLWFNKLLEDRVEMDLSFFIKKGEYYQKEEERHVQYIHTPQEIISVAEQVGFETILYDKEEKIERINFIFRRK